jgi:hypothetical protein
MTATNQSDRSRSGSRAATRPSAPYLNCPRCGLSIEVRSRWLAIRHCPRCIARTRTVVELFGSGLPADARHGSDALSQAPATEEPPSMQGASLCAVRSKGR